MKQFIKLKKNYCLKIKGCMARLKVWYTHMFVPYSVNKIQSYFFLWLPMLSFTCQCQRFRDCESHPVTDKGTHSKLGKVQEGFFFNQYFYYNKICITQNIPYQPLLSVWFGDINYIHTIVQPSPLFSNLFF